MMQSSQIVASWAGLGWPGHHFFKHVQTRLMYDAIKQNYCITIFRNIWFFKKMTQSSKIIASLFQTCSNLFDVWCNKKTIASLFSETFELLKRWCNQVKLWLAGPGWAWLGLAGPGWAWQAQNSHNAHNARTNKLLELPRS